MDLEDRTKIDVVVIGSSAVNPVTGARVGKGEGFAELEYGIMRQNEDMGGPPQNSVGRVGGF